LYGHSESTLENYLFQRNCLPKFISGIRAPIDTKTSILDFFISYNFNHKLFVDFLIKQFKSDLDKEDYLESSLEILYEKQKYFSQLITIKDSIFDSQFPSVKEQVLSWINEELKQYNRRLGKTKANQTNIPFNQTSKFQTKLTVPQLACLFKALKGSGVFSFETEKEMYKVVADHFVTPNTKTISYESLYNKNFDIETRTKESVRKMLFDALKSIND
jgi:hypothetical protein